MAAESDGQPVPSGDGAGLSETGDTMESRPMSSADGAGRKDGGDVTVRGGSTSVTGAADLPEPPGSGRVGDVSKTTVGEDADGRADGGGEAAFGSKAPAFIKRWRAVHLTWQIGVFLVGLAIISGGIAMLVLPGPGWVAIFLGLAVLGTEFVWAQRALRWSKKQATKAANKALDPRTRRRNAAFLVVGILLIAAGVAIYIREQGLPRLPW